jgi:hypothetical protein
MRVEDANAYHNKRAECWMLMRDWLKAGAEIPDDPELAIDLSGPEYGFSNKNQIQLEKKETPDLGDALAMALAVKVGCKAETRAPAYLQLSLAKAWME